MKEQRKRKVKKTTVVNKTRFTLFCLISLLLLAFIFIKIFMPVLNKSISANAIEPDEKPHFTEVETLESETKTENITESANQINEDKSENESKLKPANGEYHDILPSVAGEFVYYNQEDIRWANQTYGPTDPIGTHGCGPTVMASVVSTLTDTQINPKQMSDWAYENGYLAPGNGSMHSLISAAAWNFDLNSEPLYYPSKEQIIDHLKAGHLIVMVSGHGVFSEADGHFIILRDITDDNKVQISDSVRYHHISMDWDIDEIIHEASPVSASGGPFWAIWK